MGSAGGSERGRPDITGRPRKDSTFTRHKFPIDAGTAHFKHLSYAKARAKVEWTHPRKLKNKKVVAHSACRENWGWHAWGPFCKCCDPDKHEHDVARLKLAKPVKISAEN